MKAWAISGVHGLYYGTYPTRREAIDTHCAVLGKSWAYCRAKGDRAVRVTVTADAAEGE